MSRCRTFRYLLQPTGRQRGGVEHLLGAQCELYSAAVEARRGAWAWERRSATFFSQSAELTELRALRPQVLACGVTVCRGTLKRLDRAFGLSCGHQAQADVNAAENILRAGRARRELAPVKA